MILKTYKYRLYPTKEQERKLQSALDGCRFVYNQHLALKIHLYEGEDKNLSLFELNNHLLLLKEEHPFLQNIHSQVLQNANQRLAWAFDGFYRRVKKQEKAGFPRFKGKHRYDSLSYPQSGFALKEKLSVSKMGAIAIVKHRPLKGRAKTLTLKRTATGKWFALLCTEYASERKAQKTQNVVGIDLGLHHFYADSKGNLVDAPRYLRKAERKLTHLQRKHSRKKKSSNNRRKSRLKVARLHERISNQRLDFLHKESRKLVHAYSQIAVENLSIKNMMKNRYLAKSIGDASWQKFLQLLSHKAEEAGGRVLAVNAQGTSQYCICGTRVEKTLAVRIHKCKSCGIEIDRDIMSAIIIEQLAFGGATVGRTGRNAWGEERMLSLMNQESLASKLLS